VRFLSKDELQQVDQKEVKQIFLTLRRKIKDIESSGKLSKSNKEKLLSLQTYYCYVYRELEVRQILRVQQ
tara:strand:+ start:1066 stop:1275 length:210 start_codon:yes stop_codon:yes gene_type:complete